MEMAETEKLVDINLTSSSELISSLIEQLGKAFFELETSKAAYTNNVQWSDVEEHFHHMESVMKKKLEELEAKEKVYAERESHNCKLIAQREAAVITKEQDLLDRVQELKDAAVAAIVEARQNPKPESLEPANTGDTKGNQVSSSVDELAPLDAQEGESPRKTGDNPEGLALEANPRAELTQFCEQMDSKGLLNFVMENLKTLSVVENLKNLSGVCKEQLSVVLGSATEPARLVIDALEGFFPPEKMTQEGDNRDAAVNGMLQSCIILMEALSALFSKADSAADNFLNTETKQHALSIAKKWKPILAEESTDAANGKSLEAEGFLRLLATFRIASEFDDEELCKYVLAVAHHRQATELCHSLELTQKIPGLVETLISSGRQIDAVHFIHSFQLSEAFPPVPILKAYLKELRRNSQGNGDATLQNNYNARELEALRAVIDCVEEYKLEAAYPLGPLQKRVAQLDKSVKGDRKRTGETGKKQELKRPRSNGEFQGHRARGRGGGRQGPRPFSERVAYTGLQEAYPPAVPSAYNHPVSSLSSYTPQASDQRSFYRAQDGRATRPYSVAAPSYGAYMQPSRHPYM